MSVRRTLTGMLARQTRGARAAVFRLGCAIRACHSLPPDTPSTSVVRGQPQSRVKSHNASEEAVREVLPGVDLGKRVACPSADFPATWSADEPLVDPHDPRVMWRELYSLDHERPYYHNLQSGEVTYTIPEGFVTRFPRYYKKRGFTVTSSGAVFATHAGAAELADAKAGMTTEHETATVASTKSKLTLRQKLAAYGGGGLLWYLIIHNFSLMCVFACLYVFRIDLVELARSYGFNVKRPPQMERETVDMRRRPPFFKTFLVSIVLNKLLVPAHLLLTVTTAPFLVHKLEPVAVAFLPYCRALVARVKG